MHAKYLRVANPEENTSMVLPAQCTFYDVKPVALEVDGSAFYRWSVQGDFIQKAFPDMSAGHRELLMTGTHPKCWDDAFPDEVNDA